MTARQTSFPASAPYSPEDSWTNIAYPNIEKMMMREANRAMTTPFFNLLLLKQVREGH